MSCLAILNPTEHVKLRKHKIRYNFKQIFSSFIFSQEKTMWRDVLKVGHFVSRHSHVTQNLGISLSNASIMNWNTFMNIHTILSLYDWLLSHARLRVKYFQNLIINFREREGSSSEISVEVFETFPVQNASFVFGVDLFKCKWACLFPMTISRLDCMQMKAITNAVFSFCF